MNIGPVHLLAIRHPDSIIGSHMEHRLATPHGALQGRRLFEIAGNNLTVDTGQIAPVAVGAHERADAVARADQSTQHRRADKTRRAGQ